MAHKFDAQETMRQSFAKNLKRLMYADGMTQKDICDRLNVSAPTVSAWCNGNKLPRVQTIDALCNLFDVDRAELLSDKSKGYRSPAEDFVDLPGKKPVVAEEQTKYEANTPITMEDIALAAQIAKADPQTKRLIKYLLAFNEAEEKEKDR